MSAIRTPAIVLRATAFGEADRVVTLLGRDTGRVSALARAARKSARRFPGGLGLGALGEATLRERAGAELASLEAFDAWEPRLGLGEDVGRTAHAAYALELADRLCAPRQPEPRVFDWLAALLRRLEAGAARAERLRTFELGLLERLGLGLVLEACAVCGRADLGDETVRWLPARGGVVCARCAASGPALFTAVRAALARLARASWDEVEALALPRDVNAGAREAILEALRGHLSGPLKSLEFLAKMKG